MVLYQNGATKTIYSDKPDFGMFQKVRETGGERFPRRRNCLAE
jgi:hypothetical protein